MTPSTLARIMAHHHLARRDVLAVIVFAHDGHPGQSFTRALWDYLHGVGPAAVAMGRATGQQTREAAA